MINTAIFDLDGTLVQTERLKAQSYAKAIVELCPDETTEEAGIEAFKEVVGLSRKEVATKLMERFNLREKSEQRQAEFGVSSAWQAFVQVRLNYYEEMLADPNIILDNKWPHTLELLEESRAACRYVALATMSHCKQASNILEILGLSDAFDFVATVDDVEHGKPNPEIYNLVANELGVKPEQCIVFEDSPSGVKAALNANMHVVAIATPFTKARLHADSAIDDTLIVDDPHDVAKVAAKIIKEHR